MAKSRRIRMYSLYRRNNSNRWTRLGACGLPLALAQIVWRVALAAGRGTLRPTGHSWGPEVRP